VVSDLWGQFDWRLWPGRAGGAGRGSGEWRPEYVGVGYARAIAVPGMLVATGEMVIAFASRSSFEHDLCFDIIAEFYGESGGANQEIGR
jgi:hypothetical protein